MIVPQNIKSVENIFGFSGNNHTINSISTKSANYIILYGDRKRAKDSKS